MSDQARACQEQQGSNELDDQLTRAARAKRPKVKHWWGRRNWLDFGDGIHPTSPAALGLNSHTYVQRCGAWCYLCDAPITTWSGRWPMTQAAREAIDAHRTGHIQGRLDTPEPVGATR